MNEIWQHQTFEFPVEYGLLGEPKFASSDLADACDRFSLQGWELVSTFSMGWGPQYGATRKIVAVFRRKVAQPPPLPREDSPTVFKISSEA